MAAVDNEKMALEGEIVRLWAAVDTFATYMKLRLDEKARQGYAGWDDPKYADLIADALFWDITNGDGGVGKEVDIANRAMMLYFIRSQKQQERTGLQAHDTEEV